MGALNTSVLKPEFVYVLRDANALHKMIAPAILSLYCPGKHNAMIRKWQFVSSKHSIDNFQ
jgi:hypothetical protein